jgi:hypothetical protein
MDVDKIKEDMADFAAELRKIDNALGQLRCIMSTIPIECIDIRVFLIGNLYDILEPNCQKINNARRELILQVMEAEGNGR